MHGSVRVSTANLPQIIVRPRHCVCTLFCTTKHMVSLHAPDARSLHAPDARRSQHSFCSNPTPDGSRDGRAQARMSEADGLAGYRPRAQQPHSGHSMPRVSPPLLICCCIRMTGTLVPASFQIWEEIRSNEGSDVPPSLAIPTPHFPPLPHFLAYLHHFHPIDFSDADKTVPARKAGRTARQALASPDGTCHPPSAPPQLLETTILNIINYATLVVLLKSGDQFWGVGGVVRASDQSRKDGMTRSLPALLLSRDDCVEG